MSEFNNLSLISHYKINGWVELKQAINTEKIDKVLNHIDELLSREILSLNLPSNILQTNISNKLIELKKAAPKRASWVYETCRTSFVFYEFIVNLENEIIEFIKELLEINSISSLCITSPGLRMDSPEHLKNARPMHQDSAYFQEVRKDGRGLVAWIPLCEVSEELGSVSLINKSHINGYVKPHFIESKGLNSEQYLIPEKYINKDEEIIVKASPGDVFLMHYDLIHGTFPSKIEKPSSRFTAIIRFTCNEAKNYRPIRYKTEYLNF